MSILKKQFSGKNLLKLSAAFLMLLSLFACGPSLLTYQTANYSLNYPSGWKVLDKSSYALDGLELVLMSFDAKKEVQANLSLFLTNAGPLENLEDYLQADLENVRKTNGYEEIDFEKFSIGEVKTSLHTFKALNPDNGKESKFMQSYVPKGEKIYILTATISSEADENLELEIKKIFKAFQVKE